MQVLGHQSLQNMAMAAVCNEGSWDSGDTGLGTTGIWFTDAIQGQKEVVLARQKDRRSRDRGDEIGRLLEAVMCKYLQGAC